MKRLVCLCLSIILIAILGISPSATANSNNIVELDKYTILFEDDLAICVFLKSFLKKSYLINIFSFDLFLSFHFLFYVLAFLIENSRKQNQLRKIDNFLRNSNLNDLGYYVHIFHKKIW